MHQYLKITSPAQHSQTPLSQCITVVICVFELPSIAALSNVMATIRDCWSMGTAWRGDAPVSLISAAGILEVISVCITFAWLYRGVLYKRDHVNLKATRMLL